jgi:hypothetical protein
MATTNPKDPSFAAQRTADLDIKIKAALAEAEVAKVATIIRKCGQGEYGKALARMVRDGVPTRTLVLGYAAARAAEFAGRPKYVTKDGGHVWTQVQRHAHNHIQQAKASLVTASLSQEAEG